MSVYETGIAGEYVQGREPVSVRSASLL